MTAYSYEKIGDNFRVRDADDNRIATCWNEGHAQFIVSRLNSREELLAACKAFISVNRNHGYEFESNEPSLYKAIADAIARTEATP